MTQFGQGIPPLPQIYEDLTAYQFTKAGFVSHVVKALMTVGMIPVQQAFPWDPVADPEFVMPDPTFALFPFDYPDTATFNFNNQTWRPCAVLGVWLGDFASAANTTRSNNYLVLFDAIRKSGAFNLSDMYIFEKERTPAGANFSFGLGTATFTTAHPDTQGTEIFLANWKPYASSASVTDTFTLGVGHFFVYLGPAGLFVYVGTGTSFNQFGDLMAVGFGFGGGRIPGRELIPDVDLGHICPVFPMYMRATGAGSDMYDTTTGRLRTLVHGVQYLGKSQQFPVRAYLFNLENIERPVFSEFIPFSAPSPRAVSGGGGAHILGRIVIVPNDKENNTADLYSRIESSLTSAEVRPQWGETYTCPSLRFCDRTAPLGNHEDPVTLTNWWLVPHYSTNMLLALKAENAVVTSAIDAGLLTFVGENFYNMIGTPNPGNAFTFPNLGGGITAPVVTPTTTSAPALSWDQTQNATLDQVVCLTAGATTTNNATMDWVCPLSISDPEDTVYKLQFQWRNRNGAGTEGSNRCEFSRFFQGAFVLIATLTSAGTNSGNPNFNYVTVAYSVTIDSAVISQKQIRFRWQSFKNVASNGNTTYVSDVRLQKYRYL